MVCLVMSWALKDKSVYKDLVQYVAAKRALTFYEASSCLVFLNFYVAVIQPFNQIHSQQSHNIWD